MRNCHILPALLLSLIVLATDARAQDILTHEEDLIRRNHLSVEVGGVGGIYTLNYERHLSPAFAARLGIEYVPAVESQTREYDAAFATPIVMSFVPEITRIWGAPLSAEVGAGALLTYSSGTETFYASREDVLVGIGDEREFRDVGIAPTAVAALRLYVASEHLAFRAGVAALPSRYGWQEGEFLLWPLLSVGYRF